MEKIYKRGATYLQAMGELREDRVCVIHNSNSHLRYSTDSLKKGLIRLWNSTLPETEQNSAQLSQLIHKLHGPGQKTAYLSQLIHTHDCMQEDPNIIA